GFDAGAAVCGTVTFCDGGACSDSSDELCAVAGDADSSECAEDDGCDGAGSGDVNGDGNSDVLDIVQIVNVILGGSFADECAAEAADLNGDGSADVLDIVQIVNLILGRSDVGDATHGKLIRDNGALMLEANGYIGGVQMTLTHGADFTIELTDNALVADSRTVGNETKLVIVVPGSEELFTFSGDFEITDMIVANSESRIDVGVPTEFSLSTAYPNPFNPTTSMNLAVPVAGNVSVQVYNIMGQVVATLASGHMDANTYTLTWDASNVSSGMYFVKAEAAGSVTTQKLVLMK
ncbi:MAG: T9SS type A sorting domain-containing protein, partial [Anaerolineales bacterium]|nr:T9SS type A sorting domain-containing protein [Anaerolineales bacterium]